MDFDLEQYCEDNPLEDSDRVLFHEIQNQFEIVPNFDTVAVFYFHFTRTTNPLSFCQGLKPLSKSLLDDIWNNLYVATSPNFPRREWDDFRNSLEENDPPLPSILRGFHFLELYNLKRNKKHLTGPFGMLIRENAFKANSLGNHDYLAIPEIIEDIFLCVEKAHQIDLRSQFQHQAKSCIVKFRIDTCSLGAISTALNYIYQKVHNQNLSRISLFDFDANGMAISANQIACIECPPDNVVWGTF